MDIYTFKYISWIGILPQPHVFWLIDRQIILALYLLFIYQSGKEKHCTFSLLLLYLFSFFFCSAFYLFFLLFLPFFLHLAIILFSQNKIFFCTFLFFLFIFIFLFFVLSRKLCKSSLFFSLSLSLNIFFFFFYI